MKRVLYVLEDYPVTSETYVETEIEYFLGLGVEIAVWCRRQDLERPKCRVPLLGGGLKAAARSFSASAVHVHWLPIVPNVLVENLGVPITVRAHSFEFSQSAVRALSVNPMIAAVFLFPHFVEEAFRGSVPWNVVPLPAAYNEQLYYPEEKTQGTVVRAAAGIGGKDLDSFLETAKLCPEARFTLIVSRPREDRAYLGNLLGQNQAMGCPARVLVEVPREEAAAIVRRSEICLRSNNPTGHPFGMPISIAESMGSGTIPVVRDHPPARAYVGDAGLYFSNVQEAADRIRQIVGDPALSNRLRAAAVERAKRHASRTVLPKILETWERVCRW